MSDKKAAGLIGLATKAGKTVRGEETVLKNIRSAKAYVVIISLEASDGTKKKFKDKCSYYGIPYIEAFSRKELGELLGKEQGTSAAVIDKGFGEAILKAFSREET